ncbi:MAG: hypothetical protein GF309_06465 [Candidatus Lokiarchaeota archaeon]|nr:hypothetical protein [Candidatus Lokiarchaeota archaeon]
MARKNTGNWYISCVTSLIFLGGIYLVIVAFTGTTDIYTNLPWAFYAFFQVAVIAAGISFICKSWGIHKKRETKYVEFDTSFLRRVIVDEHTGEECVVFGSPESTFRKACRRDWPFENIDEDANWIIEDARGNDITRKRLSDYDGIARIVPKYGVERVSDYHSEERSYSSIEDSVEYYD